MPVLAPPDDALLHRCVDAIRAVEPGASVYLYGSRARGEARPDSDWDLLVLLDGPVDYERAADVRAPLYPIEWSTGHIINAMVRSRSDWNATSPSLRGHVDQDAIAL